ncbi:thiol-disulfide oxidoreductase DCC family protein [Leptolyngbya sp. KIOST-1]|uniref:thiol-disulfide oxidoreductase DCC family protein n=1 Tax=Leptolyngbya sp. KIOST-1 TaxID=1229172 RepID=UPI000561023A|nr:DCC1-like thiol-disulfide oxidoreductase family protein [Leptolyngbya sp. KIOST-1]
MYCVIYDGNCNLCVSLVRLLESLDQGNQFRYVPMQDEATLTQYSITAADCEAGMILLDLQAPDSRSDPSRKRRWQGSDAAEEIGRLLPLGDGFVQAYRALPGVKQAGDQVYAFVRDRRYELFGQRPSRYDSAYPLCTDQRCQPLADQAL